MSTRNARQRLLQQQAAEIAAAMELVDLEERNRRLSEMGVISLSQARRIVNQALHNRWSDNVYPSDERGEQDGE